MRATLVPLLARAAPAVRPSIAARSPSRWVAMSAKGKGKKGNGNSSEVIAAASRTAVRLNLVPFLFRGIRGKVIREIVVTEEEHRILLIFIELDLASLSQAVREKAEALARKEGW